MKKIFFALGAFLLIGLFSGCASTEKFPVPAGKVLLEEFGDYQCPACGLTQPLIDKLREKYPTDLVVRFVHFPLPQHENAFHAAEAAECMRDQGEDKFVAFTSKAYANQTALNDEAFKQYAKDLGMDEAKFAACLTSGSKDTLIRKDMKEGQARGVNSTPTLFLDGEKLETRKYEAIVNKIDELLAQKKAAAAATPQK